MFCIELPTIELIAALQFSGLLILVLKKSLLVLNKLNSYFEGDQAQLDISSLRLRGLGLSFQINNLEYCVPTQ